MIFGFELAFAIPGILIGYIVEKNREPRDVYIHVTPPTPPLSPRSERDIYGSDSD
jgi:hypothetical protein